MSARVDHAVLSGTFTRPGATLVPPGHGDDTPIAAEQAALDA